MEGTDCVVPRLAHQEPVRVAREEEQRTCGRLRRLARRKRRIPCETMIVESEGHGDDIRVELKHLHLKLSKPMRAVVANDSGVDHLRALIPW